MSVAVSARPRISSADPGKGRLSAHDPPARQIARRLIDSRHPGRRGADSRARGAAAVCEDLFRDLSRWVGSDGCHALFTRALAEARTECPALDQIQLRPQSEPYVEGVAETIMSHGEN